MLKRKAMRQLVEWKKNKTKQAMLVLGARQVGKTTLIREFAKENYESVIELNFYENPQALKTLSQVQSVNDFLLRLSVLTNQSLSNENALLFLDEIQEYQDVLTWVKFLSEQKNFDIILSGSLLGLDSFSAARSFPVGYLQKITMYPLDFQEFCDATKLPCEVWDQMEECVKNCISVPDYIHEAIMSRFRNYLLVGGMPDAVQSYVDTSQIVSVRNAQRAIVDLYEYDISKYVSDAVESRQIRMVYEAMPAQLNNPSKRFKYARLGKNLRFADMETAFDWLSSAGVSIEATRVGELTFPLGLSEDRNAFKLFFNDVGLLTSKLMGNVDFEIINNQTNINYGSIFENVVAQEFFAQGLTLHYYASKRFGEVDFVIENTRTGEIHLVEVKSGKDYKRHSALNNVLNSGYINEAFILCNGNVEKIEKRFYVPVYAASLITDV